MSVLRLNEEFKKRLADFVDDDDTLDTAHSFLKMAVSYVDSQVSDPEIGLFSLPDRKIKFDGWYYNEDSKEYHVFVLSYHYDPKEGETVLEDEFKDIRDQAANFLEKGFSKRDDIDPDTPLGGALQDLKDDLEDDTRLFLDFYSNIDFNEREKKETTRYLSNSGKSAVVMTCYGAAEILAAIKASEPDETVVNLQNDFQCTLNAVKVSSTSDFDIYMSSIPAIKLAQIYDKNKTNMMEGNVRAYLKRTRPTNRGIAETLKNEPECFVAYNNGLSTVAEAEGSDIKQVKEGINLYQIKSLNKLQIVNGGQTTVTIYLNFKEGLDLRNATVPLKLAVLKRNENEADLISNIAQFANTQTQISKSDLASNKFFYRQLEKRSQEIPFHPSATVKSSDEFFWFFERSNGLYNTKKRIVANYSVSFSKRYPEKCKFSKKLMAKAVNAFSQDPMAVCLGNEKSFSSFDKKVEDRIVVPTDDYYRNLIAVIILWNSADKIIKKLKLPIKAAVLPYTLAYLSYITNQRIDLEQIWRNQKIYPSLEQAIKDVSTKVSSIFVSNQELHPNTLMWGRKPDCWEIIKKETKYEPIDLDIASTIYDMFPTNPAAKFIEKNMDQQDVWIKVRDWQADHKSLNALNVKDLKILNDAIEDLQFSPHVALNRKKDAKNVFIKAVRNGFNYK